MKFFAIFVSFTLLCVVASDLDGLILGEDPRKPVEVTKALLCESCRAVVEDTETYLAEKGWKRTEANVYAIVNAETLCTDQRLRTYEFIPPQMIHGCKAFLDRHGDGLEEEIVAGGNVEKRVCSNLCDSAKPVRATSPDERVPPKKRKKKKRSSKTNEL